MKNNNRYMKDNKTIILIIFTAIILTLTTTLSFFVWNSSRNQDINVSVNLSGLDAYIHYNKGTDVLTGTLLPSTDYTGGISTEIELWKDPSAESRTIYGHIYLDITSIGTNLANEPALKWAITSNGEVLNTGDFVGKSNGNSISLKLNIPLNTSKELYQIYIWLDESMSINDAIEGETIATVVRAEATEIPVEEPIEEPIRATDYISNIYTSAEKTIVVNNNVNYHYATSVGLMNDKLGGTATGLDDGNIRYYGADPNNYIWFNNELWRIIGVFKDIDDGNGNKETRLKIARSESIGNYVWDSNNVNEWSAATLQTYLNGTYLNGLTSEAQGMIGNAKWNLGGWYTYQGLYANDYYTFEKGTTVYSGRSTEWIGKIALMYPSDYMYAGDLSKCSKDGYNWNTDQTNCRDTSWLRNTSTSQWTITPSSNFSYHIFRVYNSGYVYSYDVTYSCASRPVLYLASTVEITGGEGTSENPFTLS